MDRDELTAWLRLTLTPGVGNVTARRLLAAFGLPQRIFEQPRPALLQLAAAAQVEALATSPSGLDALVRATLQWQERPDDPLDSPERRIVSLGDPCYPGALLALEDPPLLLYYLGGPRDPGPQDPPAQAAVAQWFHNAFDASIAIVGSRNPTPQGLGNARQFGHALAQAGLTVVSGMALGVDGAAHAGAMDAVDPRSGRAGTIAIVGTGVDRVYPKRHLELARRIVRDGLMLSEYPIGTYPDAANFPRRNRLIAALSRGTLVVEAALQSGSLITARLAVEQGKDVFAIPGSIHSTQARGCHALIKQGAKLVESAQDVLEELGWAGEIVQHAAGIAARRHAIDTAQPADHDDSLLEALGFDPVGLDALLARTGLDTAHLQARLMQLELDGYVARLPGGLFQRIASA